MKTCSHSGQVISNDDGLNPVKILGDLHAKSAKEFEDQNIRPSSRKGQVYSICCAPHGKLGNDQTPETSSARVAGLCDPHDFLMKKVKDSERFYKHQDFDWRKKADEAILSSLCRK